MSTIEQLLGPIHVVRAGRRTRIAPFRRGSIRVRDRSASVTAPFATPERPSVLLRFSSINRKREECAIVESI